MSYPVWIPVQMSQWPFKIFFKCRNTGFCQESTFYTHQIYLCVTFMVMKELVFIVRNSLQVLSVGLDIYFFEDFHTEVVVFFSGSQNHIYLKK